MKYHWDRARRKWVAVKKLPPRPRIHLISDTQAPFRSMADGRYYDSKSAYRQDLKSRGLEELGNDRVEPTPPPDDTEEIEREIYRAIENPSGGAIEAPEGFREDLL